MNRDENKFYTWYVTDATDEERALAQKVEELGWAYFGDMRFESDSILHDFVIVQTKNNEGVWVDCTTDLPPSFDPFSYQWFTYHIKEVDPLTQGRFDHEEQSLTISPRYVEDEVTILHELIHLHEFVIDELPLYYHELVLWCLYQNLRSKVSNLDIIIKKCVHIYDQDMLNSRAGAHGILFLLKSIDIDLRKGYPLGTVFGYGRKDMIEKIQRYSLHITKDRDHPTG